MSRPLQARFLRVLLLTAFLLVAQLLLLQHQADLAQHANGENCEWCLAHAPLADGLPSPSPAINLPAVLMVIAAVSSTTLPAGIRTPAYTPRAPPVDLSV